MSKEKHHSRNEKKKPSMSIKERRAKKHEKKQIKQSHLVDEHPIE